MPRSILAHQQLYERAWTTPLDTLAGELCLTGRGVVGQTSRERG